MSPIELPKSALARGALCDEIAAALEALWERRRPNDESMHEVRRDLKRARGALRLLRDAVGDAAYELENVELRDAARPLSGVRDAAVGLEVVRGLLDREKKPARRQRLVELRRRLLEEREQARRKLFGGPRLAQIESSLQEAGERAEYWRYPAHDAPLRAGLARLYRKGRKALKSARSNRSTESLHESRKQVKYLEHALAIAANGSRRLRKLSKRARKVADRLGDDHDLAALQTRLASMPARSKVEDKLVARIEARRAKLQKKAFKLARRIYRRKAAAFVDRVLAG